MLDQPRRERRILHHDQRANQLAIQAIVVRRETACQIARAERGLPLLALELAAMQRQLDHAQQSSTSSSLCGSERAICDAASRIAAAGLAIGIERQQRHRARDEHARDRSMPSTFACHWSCGSCSKARRAAQATNGCGSAIDRSAACRPAPRVVRAPATAQPGGGRSDRRRRAAPPAGRSRRASCECPAGTSPWRAPRRLASLVSCTSSSSDGAGPEELHQVECPHAIAAGGFAY